MYRARFPVRRAVYTLEGSDVLVRKISAEGIPPPDPSITFPENPNTECARPSTINKMCFIVSPLLITHCFIQSAHELHFVIVLIVFLFIIFSLEIVHKRDVALFSYNCAKRTEIHADDILFIQGEGQHRTPFDQVYLTRNFPFKLLHCIVFSLRFQ